MLIYIEMSAVTDCQGPLCAISSASADHLPESSGFSAGWIPHLNARSNTVCV